jgi:glycosyltransferase involved in cell wall biosynthesis
VGSLRRERRSDLEGDRVSALRVLVSGVVLAQPMGGVRRHNQEMLPRVAEMLAERGGSLAVMAGRDAIAFALPPEIEVLPSPVPARPALARAALESRWLRKYALEARERGRPFSLIHTAHLPAPRAMEIPFTITLHDLKSVASPSEPFARRIVGRRVLRDALDRAAAVIVVSQALRDEVRELFDVPLAKLHVVANGADHLPYSRRRPARDAPLVCVGHLEPRKNVELLLRALASDATLPKLELAGSGKGDHERRLRGLAGQLGVAARVKFLGEQTDAQLAELYATCACVVLPSRREGFCIPAAEARRAGAPLAISRLPALLEVAGVRTPSFDPGDPRECARAIHTALRSPPPARANDFTWGPAAAKLLDAWSAAAG